MFYERNYLEVSPSDLGEGGCGSREVIVVDGSVVREQIHQTSLAVGYLVTGPVIVILAAALITPPVERFAEWTANTVLRYCAWKDKR